MDLGDLVSRVLQEEYGMVTPAQLRCYRKYNVSPSDHDFITEVLGITEEAAIITHVMRNLIGSSYYAPLGRQP